jgi:hypothetical protein
VRGATNELFNRLQILSVDYKMPLFYPDWAFLNGFLNFQRIKADLFTEIARGKRFIDTGTEIKNYNSIGIELTSDVNFMRFLAPFDAGIRNSYLVQNHSVKTEFILIVPLF